MKREENKAPERKGTSDSVKDSTDVGSVCWFGDTYSQHRLSHSVLRATEVKKHSTELANVSRHVNITIYTLASVLPLVFFFLFCFVFAAKLPDRMAVILKDQKLLFWALDVGPSHIQQWGFTYNVTWSSCDSKAHRSTQPFTPIQTQMGESRSNLGFSILPKDT